MTDIASISAVLTSIKTATDIAKVLRTLDASVAQAELKLKLAEMLESLADAKISAAELQELLEEKETEIGRLTQALSLQAEVVKEKDAYFMKSQDGKRIGEPFCLHCWESNKRLFHLVSGGYGKSKCTSCKTEYSAWQIPGHEPAM